MSLGDGANSTYTVLDSGGGGGDLDYHDYAGITVDTERKVIALNHLGFPQVAETVPEGVNIFNMMNLTPPQNVSLLEGWVVMINPNSSKYFNLKSVLDVSRWKTIEAGLRELFGH